MTRSTIHAVVPTARIWMDHCHNLEHASQGMVLHLAYVGVSTPFRHGPDSPNRPE